MTASPQTVVVARVTLFYVAIAFCPLAVLTVIILIRRFFITPKFRKEFLALHSRRVARVRRALVAKVEGKNDACSVLNLATVHPFSRWIDLGKDGTVTVADKSFPPNEFFQAIAQDGGNLPRATVAGIGHSGVLITSHGRAFRAKFTGTEWAVQLLEDDQS